jgi:ribonucleoside-diphosphate reductase alpha chain
VIKKIYMTGWETGCKGVTVYRDGCRTGVLVTENSSAKANADPDKFIDRHAPKRPKELPCDVVHTTVKGEKWTFFVGLHEGRPYEIMGGLSKYVSIPKRAKTGKIVKHNGLENPVPRYDFHYDFEKSVEDETIIRDIAAVFENATNAAFTRTISLALRHGTPVQYVVEQLLKGSEKEDDLFSFSRAVSRVVKHYIADGTKASEKKCPSCGSTKLIYQEGCVSCQDCGHSKCG